MFGSSLRGTLLLLALAAPLTGCRPSSERPADPCEGVSCEDANPCTDDACVDGACEHAANAAPCEDGDACTTGDACAAGACLGGAPLACERPDDRCWDAATCDPATGCLQHRRGVGTACEDGNACTEGDACDEAGSCVATAQVECLPPGNPACFAAVSCDPDAGCAFEPRLAGTPCFDGDLCTQGDACDADGACVATPVACEPSPCHATACDPATGSCVELPLDDGTPCDDLDACTEPDACVAGSCRGALAAEPGKPWLAFASHRTGDYDVWLTRTDGSCLRNLTAAASLELHPSWSPGGAVAFTSDRSGALRIWLHSLATGVETQLDTGEIRASSPVFSPDGQALAFEGRAPGAATSDTDVYLVPTAGGTPVALAVNGASDSGPTWSPDGSIVYFVSNRTGAYEIHQVVVATGAVTKRTTGARIVGRPVAGPGGDRLYFARTKAGSSSTEVVRLLLGTGAIEVVSSQGDSEPAVSPAGDRLALRTFRYGAANAELALVDELDGGGAVRLTDHPASDGAACFAPAGP